MNSDYIKENCCGVLGCRDEFIAALDLQNQLHDLSAKVYGNQSDFIIKLLATHSMVANDIIDFFMGADECLVTFSTRVGINQTVTIKTSKVIEWSKNYEN